MCCEGLQRFLLCVGPPCRASSRMAPSTSMSTSPRVVSTQTPGRRPCTAGLPRSTCLGVSHLPNPTIQVASGLGIPGRAEPLIPGPQGQAGTLSPGRLGLAGHPLCLCGHSLHGWDSSGLRKSSWTKGLSKGRKRGRLLCNTWPGRSRCSRRVCEWMMG